MTIKEFIKAAKRLRTRADAAERELLVYCLQWENDNFWREAGTTYPGFLEGQDICKASRYLAFKQGMEVLPPAEVALLALRQQRDALLRPGQ